MILHVCNVCYFNLFAASRVKSSVPQKTLCFASRTDVWMLGLTELKICSLFSGSVQRLPVFYGYPSVLLLLAFASHRKLRQRHLHRSKYVTRGGVHVFWAVRIKHVSLQKKFQIERCFLRCWANGLIFMFILKTISKLHLECVVNWQGLNTVKETIKMISRCLKSTRKLVLNFLEIYMHRFTWNSVKE